MSVAALSNEAKILRGLNQLGCPVSNFCKLAGIPRTRFEQGLRGEPGRSFLDSDAQRYLSFLERLYELQIEVDNLTKDANGKTKHLPLDWSRCGEIADALVVWQAREICVETGDHQLDEACSAALRATRGTSGS